MASCLKISFVKRNGKNITIPVNKDSHVTGDYHFGEEWPRIPQTKILFSENSKKYQPVSRK